jgi:hypothetical protein
MRFNGKNFRVSGIFKDIKKNSGQFQDSSSE